jgi:hypothetical protein
LRRRSCARVCLSRSRETDGVTQWLTNRSKRFSR